MKKIKFFAMMIAAALTSFSLAACSDDDDDNKSSNISNTERYQQEVDATVRSQKTGDKAILLVAFGSTWQQAYDAFDLTTKEYKNEFPGYDVYLSFSSAICINRAMAAENTDARSFYEPKYWLEAFGRVQYKEVVVQSLQVIPGEEYTRVINAMKDFANNSNGDLDDNYLATMTLKLGYPLMAEYPSDVDALANALHTNFGSYASKGAMLFMGHGNPDTYDTYKANIRYTQLEESLQKLNKNYYVGTVDMKENFKTHVHERMVADGLTSGNVYCAPLMSIAGDHAHNDMAGDDDSWDNGYEYNDEGEVEDTSWKLYFQHMGYSIDADSYTDNKGIVKGLLEFSNVRALYKTHTRNAETVDYYHSKNPE